MLHRPGGRAAVAVSVGVAGGVPIRQPGMANLEGAEAFAPGRRREPPGSNRHQHADERIRRKHACARLGGCRVPGPDGVRLLAVGGNRPVRVA